MATSTRIRRFKIRVSPATSPAVVNHQKPSLKIALMLMSLILLTGAISTLSIYFVANRSDSRPAVNTVPVTREPVSLTFNLSNPDDNTVVFDKDLLIQGTTSPNALVILSNNDQSQLLTPSSGGNFSLTVELEKGLNQFKLTALDNLGNSKSEERMIYFSTEEL